MGFATLTFSGPVSGSSGYLSTTGTLGATLTGNADGTVTGTWTFNGTYIDGNPYYGMSGQENISGTLTGTGGANGPWSLALTGGGIQNLGMTLSFANGQYSLAGTAGFVITYSVLTGYDVEYTFHDEFDFHAQLAVAGPSAGGGATAGNDTLSVAAGTQAVDGLGGIDTAVFAGARAAYSVSQSSANAWTVSGPDGVTTVTNVERLSFADAKVALDIGGDAGMAYRLYKAAFDRVPDIGGLGFQMKALDDGWSLSAVAANFIASPEFQSKYGNVDDTQFISLLYQNVLDRAPDDAGLQFHLGELASGQTRADILTHFSESPENQANVIGQIQGGMAYTL